MNLVTDRVSFISYLYTRNDDNNIYYTDLKPQSVGV